MHAPVRSIIERNLNFSTAVSFNDGNLWKLISAVAKNLTDVLDTELI